MLTKDLFSFPFAYPLAHDYGEFDATVGAVAENLNAALRVAVSIPARNKYLYDL